MEEASHSKLVMCELELLLGISGVLTLSHVNLIKIDPVMLSDY